MPPAFRLPVLLLTLLCHIAGPVLADRDETLLAAAETALPDVLATVSELVQIESGSNDAAGLARIADVLDARLVALGFDVTRHASQADVGADSVVGTRQGTGTQNVMLMVHMDTVYAPGALATQPLRRDGNRLYGPGTADAKGGIALILHSIALLDARNWSDYGTLTVLFNPDEETGSAGSGTLITELAEEADTVLLFEPGGRKGIGDWLLTATAEYVQVTLTVTGRASHAGTAPDRGANAAVELAHRILQTRAVTDDITGAQLNWTTLKADQAFNQIPDLAVAQADVRITREGALAELQTALDALLAEPPLVPGTSVAARFESLRPGFRGGDKSLAVATLAQEVHREVASNSLYVVAHVQGATDAGYAGRAKRPAVVEGFGVSGANYHATDEYLEIDSIPRNLYVVARLLIELGNAAR